MGGKLTGDIMKIYIGIDMAKDNEFEKLSTKECYDKLGSSSSGLTSDDIQQMIQ